MTLRTHTTLRFVLAVLTALLPATLAGAAAPSGACLDATLTGASGPLVFVDGFESGDTSRWVAPVLPAFSVAATADLGVAVEIDPATTGDHVLELRWMLPGGRLYQSVAVPFGDASSGSEARRLDGYPFPVPVASRRPLPADRASLPGSGVVESRLPVAGTSISDSALWGEWFLEIYLDSGEDPCLPPLAFSMEP